MRDQKGIVTDQWNELLSFDRGYNVDETANTGVPILDNEQYEKKSNCYRSMEYTFDRGI